MLRSPFYLLALLGGFLVLDFAAGTLAGRVVLGGDRAQSITETGDRVESAFAALIGKQQPSSGESSDRPESPASDLNCEALREIVSATNGELPRECIAGSANAPDFREIARHLESGIHVVAVRSPELTGDRIYAIRKVGRTVEVVFDSEATTTFESSDGNKAFIAPGYYPFSKGGQRSQETLIVATPASAWKGKIPIALDTNGNNRPDDGDTVKLSGELGKISIRASGDTSFLGGASLNPDDAIALLQLLPENFTFVLADG